MAKRKGTSDDDQPTVRAADDTLAFGALRRGTLTDAAKRFEGGDRSSPTVKKSARSKRPPARRKTPPGDTAAGHVGHAPDDAKPAKKSPFANSHMAWAQQSDEDLLAMRVSHALVPHPDAWDLATKRIPAQARDAVFHRDGHCCRFCGFRSAKYQEILARCGRHWDMSSLVTACIFCGQVITLERVSVQRSGVLIHAPQITQADVNALATPIYVCRISQGEAADKARATLDMIMEGRSRAREACGYDDPKRLADDILRCKSEEEVDRLHERCKDVRLFPLDRRIIKESDLEFNQFPQILAYWRSKSGPFGGSPPGQMDLSIFETTLARGLHSPVRWQR